MTWPGTGFLISWSEARRVSPRILYRHLRPAFLTKDVLDLRHLGQPVKRFLLARVSEWKLLKGWLHQALIRQ